MRGPLRWCERTDKVATANLNAWLGLDTRNFNSGVDGAVARTAGLEQRMGNASQSIGRMKSAFGGMTSAMGATTGPMGAVISSVQNMVGAFQVNPILGFVAVASAAITYFAGQVEKETQRALDATTKFTENWKKGRDQLREIGLLPQENARTKARLRNPEEIGEATLLRERNDLYMQAAQLTNTGNQAELDRLNTLVAQIKLYDDAIAAVEERNAKQAQDADQFRARQAAEKQARDQQLKDLRRQQEMVGKTELEQAQIKKRNAEDDLAAAGTSLEREKARLAVMQAEADIANQQTVADKDKDAQKPEVQFERLVQIGANMRVPLATLGAQSVATQQLQEARKQTGVLTRIERNGGRF